MMASAFAVGASAALSFGQNTLIGRAVLPATTYANGPTSGHYIQQGVTAGQMAPFPGQPVQGISALIDNHDGTYMALPDNGYGTIETSTDFYLRLYKVKPTFKTASGGSGALEVLHFIEFNDKDKKIPFAIVNHFTEDRKLTGADFDVESVQRAGDSTYWVGDEFGPFLLHFDKTGKLLDAPVQLPDFANTGKYVRSPQNPYNEEGSALRVMNAYRTHAQIHGNSKPSVFSPNASLIDDGDTAIANGDRKTPIGGLPKASTDLFNVSLLKSAGFPVVAWTVNDSASIVKLLDLGVNGIISDYPNLLVRIASSYKNKNGQLAFVDGDGLIDIKKLDVQGHRGGRGIRPENTLPAMEAGLDYFVTTLETDCGITKDGIPVLSHDPHIQYTKAYKTDNTPYDSVKKEVLIKDLTLAELQSTFTLNKLLGGTWAAQRNDTILSPVAVSFAKEFGMPHPYTIPTLAQLFDFVTYYVDYYTNGLGKTHPDAVKRAKNAARVRFNIETKFNPRTDNDERGTPFISRTVPADSFAVKIAKLIVAKGLTERTDIQSFAHQTLLKVQADFPAIRTVYLFTDSPKLATNANDGGNLQPQGGDLSPWLGGLFWPYRSTKLSNPLRALRSGGFEGAAISVDKTKLFPLLELPLAGDDNKTLLIHEFDLASQTYTGKQYKYKFTDGTNIGDFCLFNETNGLIIERDNNQGPAAKVKRVYKVTMNTSDTLTKSLVVDLLNIQDTSSLSSGLTTLPQDYGVGRTYKFPYQTIESIVVVDSATLITINDNNYPFSVGRHLGKVDSVGDDLTDDNEMIVIKLDADHQLNRDVLTGLNEELESTNAYNQLSAFPNPFSTTTQVHLSLARASQAFIEVTDLLGTSMLYKDLGLLPVGSHSVDVDAQTLPSGIYLIRMKTGEGEQHFRAIKTE